MTTNRHAYQTMRFLTFFLMIGLAGCAGGFGESDTSSDAPTFQAESEGQKLLLEKTQMRNVTDKITQSPDVSTPASAAPKACEGFPGFDRGCPGGGK